MNNAVALADLSPRIFQAFVGMMPRARAYMERWHRVQ
jgi:hypothetical protein